MFALEEIAESHSRLQTLRQKPEFAAFATIATGALPASQSQAQAAFHLRWSLETAWLRRAFVPEPLASLAAAARAAAQYIAADFDIIPATEAATLPAWLPKMAADIPPTNAVFAQIHPRHHPSPGANPARAAWPNLGTAETLMETGGDIRLQRDPALRP